MKPQHNGDEIRRGPTTRDCFDEHLKPGSRFITKYDNYFEIYDQYLGPLRDRPITLIEIGVQHGGSLQMWKRYLHPDSLVVGIDVYSDCKKFEADGIRVLVGDQSDAKFLAKVVAEIGSFDAVIDDGSHVPRHQIASFEYLFRYGLKDGGVYLVEDCATSYWRMYGGGLRRRGSFIEYAKDVADETNFWHFEGSPKQKSWLTDSVYSVEFLSSVVAFRKRQIRQPRHVTAGDVKALDLDAPLAHGVLGKIVLRAKKSRAIQGAVRRSPFLWNLMMRIKRD